MLDYLIDRGIPAIPADKANSFYVMSPIMAECNAYVKIEFTAFPAEITYLSITLNIVRESLMICGYLFPQDTVEKITKEFKAKKPMAILAEELLSFLSLIGDATPLEANEMMIDYSAGCQVQYLRPSAPGISKSDQEVLEDITQRIPAVWDCCPPVPRHRKVKLMVDFLQSRGIPARWGGPHESLYIMSEVMARRGQYILVALGQSHPDEITGFITLTMVREDDAVNCFIASEALTGEILFDRLEQEFPYRLATLLAEYVTLTSGPAPITVSDLVLEKGIEVEDVQASYHDSLDQFYHVRRLFGQNIDRSFIFGCDLLATKLRNKGITAFADSTRPVIYIMEVAMSKSRSWIEISLLPGIAGGLYMQSTISFEYEKTGYIFLIQQQGVAYSSDRLMLSDMEIEKLLVVIQKYSDLIAAVPLSDMAKELTEITGNEPQQFNDSSRETSYNIFRSQWRRLIETMDRGFKDIRQRIEMEEIEASLSGKDNDLE